MVILIIAMYKTQAHFYQVALDSMVHDGFLIMVCTVDSSQGYTADHIFADFTRTALPVLLPRSAVSVSHDTCSVC
jgi:hypothetical protein